MDSAGSELSNALCACSRLGYPRTLEKPHSETTVGWAVCSAVRLRNRLRRSSGGLESDHIHRVEAAFNGRNTDEAFLEGPWAFHFLGDLSSTRVRCRMVNLKC
jgi:hypothetical protein